MDIGKLPNETLEKIVLSNIKVKREDVLVGAAIGLDSAVIDFGDELCVMSSDPITGATKGLGRLAIHISCNDVAASGAQPIGVLMTLLLPPGSNEEEIDTIMKEANEASEEINVQIIGGHTEITDAVNRIVISSTVVGRQSKKTLPDMKAIKNGDKIMMTKYAGIEGSAILANELEYRLVEKLGKEKLNYAKSMDQMLSVVKEGVIAGKVGVRYMHDITEGGVLGAVWEAAQATKKGVRIYEDSIPVKDVTREITNILNIDLYRLISSGSMLIIVEGEKAGLIEKELDKEGIKASVIGEIVEEGISLVKDGREIDIEAPGSDELYRALELKD